MIPPVTTRVGSSRFDTRGFAVLLTLGLMAFLVLLVLALGTLTRVETRISDYASKQTQARQNALMGLNIALGRIQKFAGPDGRITATAESFAGAPGTNYYTGIWDASSSSLEPLTWLVSGNEGADARAVLPSVAGEGVELVGVATSGTPSDVVAPRRSITARGIPGQSGAAEIGNYAWWVGDEGVKAAVAVGDRTQEITYAPYDSAELRRRLRQQVPLGAGPVDATGESIFEPRDAFNAPRTSRVTATSQLAFLRRPDGTTPVGPELVRQNFHSWSADNFAVLAGTHPGGLRQDLSLRPELLGSAFGAWANYPGYIEDPTAPLTPAISPAYPTDAPREALRRRYRMVGPQSADGIAHGVAPVLSYFLITFNVRTDPSVGGTTRPLEVRARWLASFWNPYTSALVPEDLQLEVTGLPVLDVANDTLGTTVTNIDLDSLYGAPLLINLPWQPGGRADQQSWFPGRVYTWSAQEDLNKNASPPSAGFSSVFYTRTLSVAAGQGVQRAVPAASMPNSAQAHLQGNQSQLTLRLYRSLAGGGRELLRTHLGPVFSAFATTPAPASAATYQFSYVFHLAESADSPGTPELWLTTPGQDPREATVAAGCFVPGANGPRPELYPNYTSISFPDRLLDRALPASASSVTGQSYNEDTPLFELPRGPLLSLGELQHLPVVGARPFSIGNSWGDGGGWNRVYDRYFFSGLATGVAPLDSGEGQPLPNALLHVTGRKPDGTAATVGDLTRDETGGFSARYLLQGGAFNLNSVNPAAWRAVLRAGQFPPGANFSYLAVAPATGTATDSAVAGAVLGDTVCFRFPFSAQETYRADAGYAASTSVPPAAPTVTSAANTHLFRRGVRTLSSDEATALTAAVVALLRQKLADSGPFRSLEEFLGPSPLFGGSSLLERAIADATTSDGKHLNDSLEVPEFSSQWLTQADILTLLAPILFARSDTFLIRAYGDTVNPVLGTIEARAWCEAKVQRVPGYFDPAQPPETAPEFLNAINQAYGRRFKVVFFRWLTSADI